MSLPGALPHAQQLGMQKAAVDGLVAGRPTPSPPGGAPMRQVHIKDVVGTKRRSTRWYNYADRTSTGLSEPKGPTYPRTSNTRPLPPQGSCQTGHCIPLYVPKRSFPGRTDRVPWMILEPVLHSPCLTHTNQPITLNSERPRCHNPRPIRKRNSGVPITITQNKPEITKTRRWT